MIIYSKSYKVRRLFVRKLAPLVRKDPKSAMKIQHDLINQINNKTKKKNVYSCLNKQQQT